MEVRADGPRDLDPFGRVVNAMLYFVLTGLIVLFGALLGGNFLKESGSTGYKYDYLGEVYANWDGQQYKSIADSGYSYNPSSASSVAFFPAYPILGTAVASVTGLKIDIALLLVSNLCFLALLILINSSLLELRQVDSDYTVLCLCLLPTSFFFRMAYTESMFLLVTALVFCGMRRRWPPEVIAVLVGLATAIRPVGVGLIPPLAFYAWNRNVRIKLFYLIPLSCWGLVTYMVYLQVTFGDPLAFVKTQVHWRSHPPTTIAQRCIDLATFEPALMLFNRESRAYWGHFDRINNPLLSMYLAGVFYFLAAILLTIYGGVKRWLTPAEVMASAFLLLIPYCTNGYSTYFASMARYSSGVLPVYLVLGNVLGRMPPPIAAATLACCASLLCVYTSLFCGWYKVY